MKVMTYEGRVENGQVRLTEPVRLPEKAKVYVVVPEAGEVTQVRILSPRLANPGQAADFAMEVTEEPRDAGLRQ
jgi:hypothetical protein